MPLESARDVAFRGFAACRRLDQYQERVGHVRLSGPHGVWVFKLLFVVGAFLYFYPWLPKVSINKLVAMGPTPFLIV